MILTEIKDVMAQSRLAVSLLAMAALIVAAMSEKAAAGEPYEVHLHDITTNNTLYDPGTPPDVDRDAFFRRWARTGLNDPDGVKDVHVGQIFRTKKNIFLSAWGVCVAFNSKNDKGGYNGLRFWLFMMSEDDPTRVDWIFDQKREERFFYNCLPFKEAVLAG